MSTSRFSLFRSVFDALIGPRFNVFALAALMVLTFAGTLYQVDHGLFAAQERFYNSWFLLLGGFLPFPGAQLVLALMTANLALYLLAKGSRMSFGILLTHAGLLLLLVGGGITHYFAEESQLTMEEGEVSSVSASYHHWELATYTQQGELRDVRAVDADGFEAGRVVRFDDAGLSIRIEQYHRNARAFQAAAASSNSAMSSYGISSLRPARPEKEPAQNVPGGLFLATSDGAEAVPVILYGEDVAPSVFTNAAGQLWHLALRRVRYPLPFVVTLLDFQREVYPGTETPKSFSSHVAVSADGLDRTLTIAMNKPMRDRGYTLFQASYSEQPGRPQVSTLAVTRNYGRLIPYVSTGVVVLGLLWHFAAMLVRRAGRTVT